MRSEITEIKLHLGCGRKILPGFINADITKHPGVDVCVDINDLSTLAAFDWYGKVSFIYLAHVLEHFPTEKVPEILTQLNKILKVGGVVRISVPDLDKTCRLYVKNIDWFAAPHNPWLGLLYGGQIDEYDFHKTGFNFRWIQYLLTNAGFGSIIEVNQSEDLGIRDGSFAKFPFGDVSLTVEAVKGVVKSDREIFQFTAIEKTLGAIERALLFVFNGIVYIKLALIRRRTK